MRNYNFHELLGWKDFQALVCDIVQIRDNLFLETYKEGRDFGIDGLHTNGEKKTIVQAKRYKPDFNRLKHDLEKNELPKVHKLNPDRYILGVSMDFNSEQKEKIMNLFGKYILNTDDIISSRDMNNLLGDPRYKHIELAYTKLWLPSINVFNKTLQKTVHRALYKESEMQLKEAIDKSQSFVSTRIFRRALQMYEQKNVVILSGEPGVGKTTMAYLLALAYLQPNNLDGFVWANSIEDVYKVLEEDRKQVIILDDFWGSIFQDEHKRRNYENRLNKLIKHVVDSKMKNRLILTTREYILQQGMQKSPLLKETLDQYSLICTMEEYGYDEKARIFFSHIYTSKLNYIYAKYLYYNSDSIIYHSNYNPRVLALFLDKDLDEDCSPEDYFNDLCAYLDNPTAFWKDIFLELSEEAQIVAMLLLISSTPMLISDMESCYRKLINSSSDQIKVKNISDCIAELERTMIKSYFDEEMQEVMIKFTMPAVQDFLFNYISENSGQYVPRILQCCNFYNQLQFLFERLSEKSRAEINDLIIQECILHYDDYSDSYMEYDGSWNWDYDYDVLQQREELSRFFHLIRCCDPVIHRELFLFLEYKITEYCTSMGSGDLVAQYTDLHNLPDIIVRCFEKGMSFSGKDIIDSYWKEAFSVYHYRTMQKFEEIFPEEYADFHQFHYEKIKKHLRRLILEEIDLLYELDMDYQLELLIDDIPNILKQYGLRYTKKFGDRIYFVTGRRPYIATEQKRDFTSDTNYIDSVEVEINDVKEEARSWLFGPTERDLEEDEILEIISRSQLTSNIKSEFIKVVRMPNSNYFYDLMTTQESIELLIDACSENEIKIDYKESHIYIILLCHLGKNEPNLIRELFGFCAESLFLFVHEEEPVIRLEEFLSSEVYEFYLKDDNVLRDIVFEKLVLVDDQWVRFLHIPLFIFCNVFIVTIEIHDENLEEYYHGLWGDNFYKMKLVTNEAKKRKTNILYLDFGRYYFRHFGWEGCMYRLFEELIPFHFNEFYVGPKLRNYIDELGDGDINSKVLNHISSCKYQYKYTKSGHIDYVISHIDDELSMIEHLIAEIDIFPDDLPRSLLKELQKGEKVCGKIGESWYIYLSEINDMEVLKKLGVYDKIHQFIKSIEKVNSRFNKGDFSPITELI